MKFKLLKITKNKKEKMDSCEKKIIHVTYIFISLRITMKIRMMENKTIIPKIIAETVVNVEIGITSRLILTVVNERRPFKPSAITTNSAGNGGFINFFICPLSSIVKYL